MLYYLKKDDCYSRFHAIKRHKPSPVTQDVQQAYTAMREDLM